MTERDETLERVIDTLKQPVDIDAGFDRRVMNALEQLPRPEHKSRWLAPRWTIRISPIGGLAAAAALAGLIFATSTITRRNQPTITVTAAPVASQPSAVTQFVLVAPEADSVLLVGDFNDWGLSTTRLIRQPGDGVWFVTVSLPPGRYRYAFIINGTTWRSDPATPAAEDEFGRANSVVTVGGAT
ncbi:MAG: isoamylase early set domain-containing protein [Gemmatimonadota bacterium]